MVKKSEIKTIAQCQDFLRRSIDVENFCYDVSTISFYSGDVKITILNADFKPVVEKGVKLADLQSACSVFSQTYNYKVICRDADDEVSIAIHSWDANTKKIVLFPTKEEYQTENSGDLPNAEIIASYDRPIGTIPVPQAEKKPKALKIESIAIEAEDIRPIKLPNQIEVYVCLADKENQSVKKKLPLTLEEIRPHLTAWLHGTDQFHQGQISRFKNAVIDSPHNALVLYFYRPYVWQVLDVAGEKQLRKVDVVSASKAQILSKNKGTIQQSSYTGIPELGSMHTISPIKILEDGNVYLAQAYIELVDDEYLLRSRKIALFSEGVLRYYSDLSENQIDQHDIHELVQADGRKIFPQMSIALIELQTLEVNSLNADYYVQTKVPHYEPVIGGRLVLKSSVTDETDMSQFVKVGNEYLERNTYLNTPVRFDGIKHPNINPKTPKKHEITYRQTPNPKPVKLHNEKVVSGTVEFTDIIGTVPMVLRLVPSESGYSLTGLPIKLPDAFTYDLARYITSNLGMSALGYLNDEVARVRAGVERIGKYTRQDMIDALKALIVGIKAGQKIDPTNVLESKNKLKSFLSQQNFTASTLDLYYSFYTLGHISIVTETEGSKYSYRLTNFGDPKALYRENLSTVQTWIQRVSYNLKNFFGIKKPNFNEIKTYLKEHFKFQNCELRTYYDKGIYFEVWHNKKLVAKQLVEIVNPENYQVDPEKLSKFSDQRRAVLLGRTPVWANNRVFEKVLRCSNLVDSDIIQFAKRQLHKVVDKFISSNQKELVGENRVVQTTAIKNIVGFDKTSHGFSNIKSTFLKFVTPFSSESEINRGKVFNLKTGKIIDQHSANELFQLMVNNWKIWSQNKNETIKLGDAEVKKSNPGKLMLDAHNKVYNYSHLDQLVWGDLIEVWWQLTGEPIGFRTNTGVVLTPWSMLSSRVDVWEYRLKMQLIDILRENKNSEGKIRTIEAHLQLDENQLRGVLNATYPSWQNQISSDVRKHIDALENSLSLSRKSANL